MANLITSTVSATKNGVTFYMDIQYVYSWDSSNNLTFILYPELWKSSSVATTGTYFWFAQLKDSSHRAPAEDNNYTYASIGSSKVGLFDGDRTLTVPIDEISFNSNREASLTLYCTVALPNGTSWEGTNLTFNGALTFSNPNTYTITYRAPLGSGAPSSQTVVKGKPVTLSNTQCTRTGYTHWYWASSTLSDGSGDPLGSYSRGQTYSGFTGNTTLYAVWTPNVYSIKYYNCGGTGSTTSQSMTYGTTASLISNPFSAPSGGYGFYAWASSTANAKTGSYSYTANQKVNNLTSTSGATVSLYAIWRRFIEFRSGINETSSTTVTNYYGGNITTPTSGVCAVLDGWTKLGWRDDHTAGAKEYNFNTSITPTASTTRFYAVYSRTLTFYSGISKAQTTTKTGYYNSYYNWSTTAPIPTTANYSWNRIGWRNDTSPSTSEYGSSTAVTKISGTASTTGTLPVTFYAVYDRNIIFKYFATSATTSVTTGTRVQYLNSNSTTPSGVTTYALYPSSSYGWSPLGWRGDTTPSTASAAVQTGASTSTLYPAYNASSLVRSAVYSRTVGFAYNANGGGTAPSKTTGTQYYNVSNTTASSVSLTTAGAIARAGYKQTGWALDSISGTVYNLSTAYSYPSRTWSSTATRTLYALWDRAGSVYIHTSDGWKLAIPYIWNGSQWKETQAYVYNGSAWKTLS